MGPSQGLRITLDAENAEVYPVLQEVARQSGIPVLSRTNATGRVTVHFRRVPVEDALSVLADQTDGSWQKLYLIGRNHQAVQKVSDNVIKNGPPFLLTQMAATWNDPLSIRELSASTELEKIDFKVTGKEFQTTSLELALKTKTPLAVEETLNPVVNFETKGSSPSSAIQELAQVAQAIAEVVYHFNTPNGRGWRDGSGDSRQASQDGASEEWRTRREEVQKMISQQMELLPPEEKEKAQQQRDEWTNLTPEERRKKWNEMANSPAAQARAEQRFTNQLKNLTPEQWAARYKRFVSRQKQQQGT